MSIVTSVSLVPGIQQSVYLQRNVEWILVSNISPYDLTYSGFGVFGEDTVPSGVQTKLYGQIYSSGNFDLRLVNSVGISPANNGIVIFSQFIAGFDPEPPGTWPVAIPARLIGALTPDQVQNTGNPAGTTFIFAEPVGDASPVGAVNITNDGKEILGDALHSGSLTVNHETASVIDFTSILNGNSLSFADSAFQLISMIMTAADPSITLENHAGSSSLVIQTGSPTIDLSNSTGAVALLVNGAIKSNKGGHTLQDWNFGIANAALSVTVTHGIKNAAGVATAPTAVFVCPTIIGNTFLVNTVGATTFNITVSTNNQNVFWLALLA